jgi:hypothetical protein
LPARGRRAHTHQSALALALAGVVGGSGFAGRWPAGHLILVWTFMVFDIVKREKHETLLFAAPA